MDEKVKIALEKQNPWWFDKSFPSGIDRPSYRAAILKYLRTPEILLLVGARRTGKSTLLYQTIHYILKKGKRDSVLFINLDEPLFQSKADDPAFLGDLIASCLAERPIKYVFIDEIQNYQYWAQMVKTLYDTQKDLKIILTGSSSTLIHSKLATRLSGRFFHVRVFPLSFSEYLNFNEIKKPTIIQLKQCFTKYLHYGGFPRVVLEKDVALKQELLKNYFQTIYLKDIIYPHNLRNNKDVFDLLFFMLSNAGKPFSYTSISKVLKIAVDTVKEYVKYAEEAYLMSAVTKYDPSVKKQIINPKKFYCIDTGMINAAAFQFSENRGRLLENLVYETLIRTGADVYYHKEQQECDFVIKKGLKITEAVQVTLSLKDPATRKRELKGLLEAMDKYKLKEGLIITENEQETFTEGDKTITVKSAYRWLQEINTPISMS